MFYQFKNEEKAGLGMPMPSGTVRVYQSDSKGGVQRADQVGGEDETALEHRDHQHPVERRRLDFPRQRLVARRDRFRVEQRPDLDVT